MIGKIMLITIVLNATSASSFDNENIGFISDLFYNIINIKDSNNYENVIFSPFSIKTGLAMTLMGAKRETKKEIATGLHLDTNKQKVAEVFHNLLDNSANSAMMSIANKIYVRKDFKIKKHFNDIASKIFHSEAETIDFSNKDASIKTINDWISLKTNNKVNNLLDQSSIDDLTRMLLINAIYFKGKWATPFKDSYKTEFFNNGKDKVSVDMMQNDDDRFSYGEIPNLDAKALEMEYENSNFSMMIILPNKADGLKDLETKLKTTNIFGLKDSMNKIGLKVRIPKFKIDFSINLNEVLKNMGMKTMFSDQANFSDLLDNSGALKMDKVVHKAFINVDENGSEAAAATVAIVPIPVSLAIHTKSFEADHPFVFLIKDQNTVYFMGHINKF